MVVVSITGREIRYRVGRYKIKFSSNGEISTLKRAAAAATDVPVSPLRMPFISLRRSREAVFRRPVVLGQGCQSQVTVVCSSANFFLFEQFHEMLLFSLMNDIYKRMPKKNSRINFEFTALSSSEFECGNQEQNNSIFYCSGGIFHF